MTILWAENFNIYGAGEPGRDRMGQGFYLTFGEGGIGIPVSIPAVPGFDVTGKRWFSCNSRAAGYTRLLTGGPYASIGVATRIHMSAMPTDSARTTEIIKLFDNVSNEIAALNITPTGNIQVLNSTNTVVATTTTPPILLGTSHKVQAQFVLGAGTGTVEVRVDGVAVIGGTSGVNGAALQLTGANINIIGQRVDNSPSLGCGFFWSDFVVPYTLTGTYNSSFPNISGVVNLQMTGAPVNTFTGRPLQLYGAGQLRTSASLDALDCGAAAGYDIGAGDYTIEGWFRSNIVPSGTNQAMLWGKWNTATNNRSYRLVHYGPSLNNGELRFEISTDGAAVTTIFRTSVPYVPQRGRWYHIAVCRSGTTTRVFIDGVQIGVNITDANTYFAAGVNAKYAVGGTMSGVGTAVEANTSVNARFDEHRVTVGVARYTANFTPPAAAYPRGGGDASFASVQLIWGLDASVADESTTAPKTIALRGAATRELPADASANFLSAEPLDPLDERYIETPFLPAQNILQLSALPLNAETVTIGASVYTFNTVLGGAGSVLIGATLTDSLTNLNDAINLGAGSGTRYGVGTVLNASARSQVVPTVNDMTAIAKTNGAAGNTIVSTETLTNGLWLSGATFLGGADIPTAAEYTVSALPPTTTGVRAVFLVDLSYVPSDNASLRKSLVVSGVAAAGAINALGITPSYRGDLFEEDPSTVASLTPTSIVNSRIRLARTT